MKNLQPDQRILEHCWDRRRAVPDLRPLRASSGRVGALPKLNAGHRSRNRLERPQLPERFANPLESLLTQVAQVQRSNEDDACKNQVEMESVLLDFDANQQLTQ